MSARLVLGAGIVWLGVVGVTADMMATCNITKMTGTNQISGLVHLHQVEENKVKVTGTIVDIQKGKHGFHVHQVGELGNACKDAKGHFNPDASLHGAPNLPRKNRHAGDFGNIVATDNNEASIDITMEDTQLDKMLNRAIVVHAGEDDLGLGGKPDSNSTGAAGARLGCCVIEASGGSRELASVILVFMGIVGLLV